MKLARKTTGAIKGIKPPAFVRLTYNLFGLREKEE